MPRSGQCKTDLLNFDIPALPPLPTLPGFGQNINLPGLDIPFPEGFPENLFDLLNKLKLKWPGGITLSGLLDNFMRKLSQLISNILTQMATFLALYNLILAIIQLIVCIIEVLCALVNPVKVKKKLKKLFRTCMPIFLSIFPFLALIALILAILALLMALIEYILAILKKIYDELKRNFENLSKALGRDHNKAATIAIIRKIASILCILENLVILFLLIKTVIDIIKTIKDRSINPPCKNTGCKCDECSECADILLHPENVISTDAQVVYNASFDTITNVVSETVTLQANNLPAGYTISNIISSTTAGGCHVGPFFPPQEFPENYDTTRASYLINLVFNLTDGYGTRNVSIDNVLVNNVYIPGGTNGEMKISGGVSTDPLNMKSNWTIKEIIRGYQGSASLSDNNITETMILSKLTPNYDSLMGLGLITADCDPEIMNEKDMLYSSINENQLNDFVFPDIDAVTNGIDDALSKLRKNVNNAAIDDFNNTMNNLMNNLKASTEAAYAQILDFIVSPLHSTAELTPDVQFIIDSIKVKAVLKNASSQTFPDVIGDFPVPQSAGDKIAGNITAKVTLGKISSFSHDGYGNFFADITSQDAGDGVLTVFYSGQQFGQIIRPDDITQSTTVVPLEFNYTFVGVGNEQLGVRDGRPRRDETDTAANNR